MGCWNETCIISGLPIQTGQEVVCIVPEENFSGHLQLCPFPGVSIAEGTIDDYGSLDEIRSTYCKKGDEGNSFSIREYHNQSRPVLFALKEAWDKVVAYAKEHHAQDLESRWKHHQEPYQLVELQALLDRLTALTEGREVQPLEKKEEDPESSRLLKEWIAVSYILYKTRRCYDNMNQYTGNQHIELEAHAFMNQLAKEQLEIQQKEFTYE